MKLFITCWYRDLQKGRGLEFNHITTGWNPDHKRPAYVTDEQSIEWKGGVWVSVKAYKDDLSGEVIEL